MARKVRKIAARKKQNWSYKRYGKARRHGRGLGDASFNPARAWQEFEEGMAEAYARGQINDDIQRAVGRLGDALYDLREVNGHSDSCDEIPDRADHVKRTWNVVKAALTPAEATLAAKVVAAATGQARETCPLGKQPYRGAAIYAGAPSRERGSFPAAAPREPECGIVCKVKKFFGG